MSGVQFPAGLTLLLGWTLVHFVWQGALIGAVYFALRESLARQKSTARYRLALMTLMVCFAAPIFTFIWLLSHQPEVQVAAARHAWAGPDLFTAVRMGIEALLPLLVVAWALGVSWLTLRTFVGLRLARALCQKHVRPLSEPLARRFEALARRFVLAPTVRVLQSTQVVVPTVIGWARPVVLLPASLVTRLSPEQLELVVAHEFGHIRRFDYLVNLIQIMVETLLFYHPVVRWVSRDIRIEREHCCDDLVVATMNRPVDYARVLADLAEHHHSGIRAEPALAATGGDLLQRVARLLHVDQALRPAARFQAMSTLLVAGLLTIAAINGLRSGVAPNGPESRLQLAGETITLGGVNLHEPRSLHAALSQVSTLLEKTPADSQAAALTSPAPAHTLSVRPEASQADRAARVAADVSTSSSQATPAAQSQVDAPQPALSRRAMLDQELARINADLAESSFPPPFSDHELAAFDAQALASMEEDLLEEELSGSAQALMAIEPVKTHQPSYPWKARANGVEGFVKLEFSLSEQGEVESIEVVDAYPEKVFNRAAKRALSRWRFNVPGDFAENLRLQQTFDFTLMGVEEMARTGSCKRTGSRLCRRIDSNMEVVYINAPPGS